MTYFLLAFVLLGATVPDFVLSQESMLSLNITTVIREPFLFDLVDLDNNSRRVGLIKDILDALSVRMNFTYEFYLSPDGNYGAPDADGIWNGMVGEVSIVHFYINEKSSDRKTDFYSENKNRIKKLLIENFMKKKL